MDEAALGMVSSLVGCKVIHLLCNPVRYAGAGCVFLSGINWHLSLSNVMMLEGRAQAC